MPRKCLLLFPFLSRLGAGGRIDPRYLFCSVWQLGHTRPHYDTSASRRGGKLLTPADHTALAVAKRGLRAAGHDSVRGRPTVVGSWRRSGAVTSRLCGSLSVRFSPGAIAAKVGVRSLANRVGTFSATRGGHLSRRGADLDAVYRHGVRQRSGSRHVRSRRTASAGAAELGLEAKPPRHRGEQSLRETVIRTQCRRHG